MKLLGRAEFNIYETKADSKDHIKDKKKSLSMISPI